MPVLLLLSLLVVTVSSQGRLTDPPSRSSAWRYGFNTPVNYDDHMMNCGSEDVQWNKNGGKCGICGDSYTGPRFYERPYGMRVQHDTLTKTYQESSTIKVNVEVTANRKGWSEFRICDITKSGGIEASQSCLDSNLLADEMGNTRFYFQTGKIGNFQFSLILPKGLACAHCVLQWKWRTGGNWGCDDKTCGLGHGRVQEEFYGCSDVAVLPINAKNTLATPTPTAPRAPLTSASSSTSSPSTTKTSNPTLNPYQYCILYEFYIASSYGAPLRNPMGNSDFLNMLLGLPNAYNSGYLYPSSIPSTTTKPPPGDSTTSTPCQITHDAINRFCAACYSFMCPVTLCFNFCPKICYV